MVATTTTLESLPTEILVTILSSFRTKTLLPLALTSRRFYDVIALLVEARVVQAASLAEHTLILEVFHPSAKLTTPYFMCKYLGAGSVKETKNTEELFDDSGIGKIGKLADIYGHFEPLLPHDDRPPRRHPAGGLMPETPSNTENPTEYVSQDINLESHELFSQLCSITSIVKVGPKRGLFLSLANISEGTIRVWRDFLSSHVAATPNSETQEKGLLWADSHKHVGLQVTVTEADSNLLMVSRDEDPVSYTLHYREMVIRATQLLLMIEESNDQEVNHSGMYCGLDGLYFTYMYRAPAPVTRFKQPYGNNMLSFGIQRSMISV